MNDERKTKKQLIDELEELRGRKDAFQGMADQSADAITTTDLVGRYTYFSPGAEKLTGFSAEEVLGRYMSEFTLGGHEEAKAIQERLRREEQITNYELPFLRKDGEWM